MANFAHLHLHTEYSLLDGACRIKKVCKRAKELGQDSIAITDHGVMFGVIDFYKEAKNVGIKPIIGCEVYVASRSRLDKTNEHDRENFHLVLLCENNKGYENLSAMVSKGFVDGFYSKPRIDYELLEQYHEGLIALSACLAGEIPRKMLKNDYDGAKKTALKLQNIFGENNFFLELQDHGIKEQKLVAPQIIKLSNETGIPLVCTNDCHYILKEEEKMHHILMCIQTNHTVEDDDVMEFGSSEFYLKSEDEMRSLFKSRPDAFDNTQAIANRCNVDFSFGETKLPHYDVPDNMNHLDYLKMLAINGAKKYYGQNPDSSVIDRLNYELDTISTMGFVDYFLIVFDFINYAKSVGIPVGPGRGSGAGSLVAYCIGITGIDPLKYNLLFERFLNPERVSMPDFDIDFCYERRQEVIDYVNRKYGSDHVAQIITFGTMKARGAIRDVGRAMAIPYQICDSVAKAIPTDLGMTIEIALEKSTDLRAMYLSDDKLKELIDMAKLLEGMPRHASKHAAAVVITDKPVVEYVPLSRNDDSIVTQFTMTTIEELGLLKMDFLGLRTLTVISDTEKMVQKYNPEFSIEKVEDRDKKTYEMISQGLTEGVFQFESAGMRNVLMQLCPESIEDLTAVISLYRPGPMSSIPTYIANKHNAKNIKYAHPMMSKILDVTYGCMVYQEQVMQIFRELAGFSLGRADIVRRAMSKKKKDIMERERHIFINGLKDDNGNVLVEGCLVRGVDEKSANKVVADMESFASYAFNKSHAAAYSVVSYQTAYLKCNYPKEYMAAILTSFLDDTNKVAQYMAECSKMNITILPPSVNESDVGFTVTGGNIRFGLLAIKNLGRALINSIIKEKNSKEGKFSSFYNFCKRMYGSEMNKRALESLIRCGALDGLGQNRHQMLLSYQAILQSLDVVNKQNLQGQIGFFDLAEDSVDSGPTPPDVAEFELSQMLAMEKEVAGMFLSGHPMEQYEEVAKRFAMQNIAHILSIEKDEEGKYIETENYSDNTRISLLAIIANIKTKITRNNTTMAFVTVEDRFGQVEMLMFASVYEKYKDELTEGKIVHITARLSIREDEDIKLICEHITPPPTKDQTTLPRVEINNYNRNYNKNDNKKTVSKPVESKPNETKNRAGLYLRASNVNSEQMKKAQNILAKYSGDTAVYCYFEDSKTLQLAPKKLWVSVNQTLINELKNVLGEKNVAVKN